MRTLKVNMKNKENYQDLFGISIDKKVTCVKPDRCSYIMPTESCSFGCHQQLSCEDYTYVIFQKKFKNC